MDFFQKIYSPIIRKSLDRKLIVIVVSVALFIVSMILFFKMGGEFIPTLDEGDFAVETRVLTGSSISETIEATEKASRILLERFPEVEQVVAKIGSGEIPTDPMPIEAADIMIILKERKDWTSADSRDALADKMSVALSEIPGVTFGFQQPIQMRFNELMTGAKQDVIIKIYGEDLDVLAAQAKKVGRLIQPIDGVEDLYIEEITGLPQINIKFNRERIATLGLNIEDINTAINTAFAGNIAGSVYEGEKRFDMVVRLDKESRNNIDNVKNLFITAPNGNQIPLEQLAEVAFKVGPNQIQRDDTKRRITIGFNIRNRDVESIVDEIKSNVAKKIKLPVGYHLTYGGQFQNLIKAKERLGIAVPIALLLIFILLYFTFNSIKHSLLIFTAIPLSAIGGIFALWIRDMPFSISAGIGFIALFGVAVLNGIVLISYFNQLRKEGMTNTREIILLGTSVRLRPIILTALVASLGFLPMALSNSSGAEVQKPLATVVIGGLISATLLTLLVLPILYSIFDSKESVYNSNNRWWNKSKPKGLTILLLLISLGSFSQNNINHVTLQEALELALANNAAVRSAGLQVDLQKNLKGTSTDLGKTSVGLLVGQTNSVAIDNYLEISQTIPFPNVLRNQILLSKSQVKSSEIQLRVTQNELKYNVKSAYYQLAYFKAKRLHLQALDSLYESFVKAAELRYRTGESNLLEKTTAESQSMEVKSNLIQNESDIEIWQSQLQTLLNSTVPIDIADSTLTKITLTVPTDSMAFGNNASMAYFKHQIAVSERAKALEKSKLLPDLTIGYFNQTLRGFQNVDGQDTYYGGDKRFMGIQAGVSIPVWAGPSLYRIKAAEVGNKIAQANLQYIQKNLEGEYRQLLQSHLKHKANVEYYEKAGLPHASLILKQAQLAFKNGAIGYVEFTQALSRVSYIQSNYLDGLNAYNQSILSIELLLGNI